MVIDDVSLVIHGRKVRMRDGGVARRGGLLMYNDIYIYTYIYVSSSYDPHL